MAIDIEKALAGEHGDEAQKAAEVAVRDSVGTVVNMLKPSIDAAMPSVGLASGGVFKGPAINPRFLDGEYIVPVDKAIRERAFSQGHTELRFDPETMGWAYHKPDQAVGDDGRVYVRKRDA